MAKCPRCGERLVLDLDEAGWAIQCSSCHPRLWGRVWDGAKWQEQIGSEIVALDVKIATALPDDVTDLIDTAMLEAGQKVLDEVDDEVHEREA